MKASSNTTRAAQLQYCRLSTSIVDDDAIKHGIVSAKNVTPILFFFIEAGNNEIVRSWVMPDDKPLKEGLWVQILGWLMNQLVFIEPKKRRMAEYLYNKGEIGTCSSINSIRVMLQREPPRPVSRELDKIYHKYFKI